MDPSAPSTWRHYVDHPSIAKFGLVHDWRDWYRDQTGKANPDPDADLSALRRLAERLLREFPGTSVELIVLDDLTTYVTFSRGLVVGQFGLGCGDGTYYCHVEADSSNPRALEEEFDNLSLGKVLDMVARYIPSTRQAVE